jgi:voltage-gated potassium channel Kch
VRLVSGNPPIEASKSLVIRARSVEAVYAQVGNKDFPTFGIGLWWAIATLGTVGYGDVVPHTAWGRVLGGVVIVFGVTFISFLVAIVTSLFVDSTNAGDKHRREGSTTRPWFFFVRSQPG